MNQIRYTSIGDALCALLLVSTMIGQSACSSSAKSRDASQPVTSDSSTDLVRSNYKVNEITHLCEEAIAKAKKSFDKIGKVPPSERNFDNTVISFDTANGV